MARRRKQPPDTVSQRMRELAERQEAASQHNLMRALARGVLDAYLPGGSKYTGERERLLREAEERQEEEMIGEDA